MFNLVKILNLLLSSLLAFNKFIGVRYTSILIINNMLLTLIKFLVNHFYPFYKKILNKINLKNILHTYYFNSFKTQLIFFFLVLIYYYIFVTPAYRVSFFLRFLIYFA
jgi:hypothetical protein